MHVANLYSEISKWHMLICLQREIAPPPPPTTLKLSVHLQGPSLMADVLTVAMLTRRILGEENDKVLIVCLCL
jgi:hypothetical protein